MPADVLLIGATSPLGRALFHYLRAQGCKVVGTSRVADEEHTRLDVTDAERVRQVLQGVRPRRVVYLADPTNDHAARIPGEVAAFGAAVGMDSFIFASSAAVYGTRGTLPHLESDPREPETDYGRRKAQSEDSLTSTPRDRGFHAVALRIFNIYGPGFDRSLVNRLGGAGDQPPSVFSSADFVRDYIHVDDVCEAFSSALDHSPEGQGEVFNVGCGEGVDNLTLLSAAQIPFVDLGEPPRPSCSIADIHRARLAWGFKPLIGVVDALGDPGRHLFA